MPVTTTRLGLVLPDPGENYDVTIPNGNFTKLENAAAHALDVTSGTRPSSPGVGDLIYETDTDELRVWNGAAWLAADSVGAENLISRVAALEAASTSLDGRLDTAEGTITSLGSRMTDAESDLASLAVFFGLKFIAGTIRSTGGSPNSWEVIDDSAHTPIGPLTVNSVSSTGITIGHVLGATQVGALIATPDEFMASLGWVTGASVGLTNSVIQIGNAAGTQVNPTTVSNSSANIWIMGFFM